MKEQENINELIKELTEVSKKEKRVKQKLHYDTVLLFLEGYKRKEIAAVLHLPESTVNHHIRTYQKGGIDALIIKKAARL